MIIQGSEEWFAERRGKATASRIADIVAKTKSGYSASRANYMAQIISERLTGVTSESYSNAAMQWGIDTEPEARDAYSFHRDVDVAEVGFVVHPSIPMSGASPDGMVGEDGMVEIKCPNTATHIDTLLSQKVPGKYNIQMQWQMACCGSSWCDYVSYDPRLPEYMRLFVVRIDRDDEHIDMLQTEVKTFLDEVDNKIADLTRLYLPKERDPADLHPLEAG